MASSSGEENGPALPRISHMNPELHYFSIGKHQRAWHVHKDLLCHYSPYFRAALTGEFLESTKDETTLPIEFIKVIDEVIDWLYTRKLQPLPHFTGDLNQHKPVYRASILRITNLYIFGDSYEFTLLRDAAISKFHKLHCSWQPHIQDRPFFIASNPEVVSRAFERLPGKSLFCQYLVDAWAHVIAIMHSFQLSGEHANDREQAIACVLQDLPPQFLARLIAKNVENERRGSRYSLERFWTDATLSTYVEHI